MGNPLRKTATELAAEAGMSYGDYLAANGPSFAKVPGGYDPTVTASQDEQWKMFGENHG